jgi:NAD(P)-dependent dehydrogenase (short-subunit alcohol dehydrogenase family)
MSVYSASKAAVRSLARTLAAEYADKGVRVNCIAPGPIETPIYGRMGLPSEAVEEFGQQIQSQVPINRFGQADEIARVALFLASTDSSYMTGSVVTVDGGFAQV